MMPNVLPIPAQLDEFYIGRCLQLAERGWGTATPNPMVGAVVLDAKGRKVGEGFHVKAGESHAEVIALDKAGDSARGGTLYVNLEPCCHTGRTPPCVDRVIASGIDKVVIGTLDPNPLVAGKGRDALQNHRITVRHGFLTEECQRLNEIFFHHITTRRPFVTLKLAMTLDGKIATRDGQSQWLTGEMSRQYVHWLRQGYDAILTTADTVLADNPQLTVRLPQTHRAPVRIVLDRRMRLDPTRFRIFDTHEAATWVVTSTTATNHHYMDLARAAGVEVLTVPDTGMGLDLKVLMEKLGEMGVTSLFVEAGGKLAGQLLAGKLVNKCYFFYAPMLLADPSAMCGFSGRVQVALANAPRLRVVSTRQIENDWVVEAYPRETLPPPKKLSLGEPVVISDFE
jgi:diaminohydroxyphosphoribosylaminopyrimidine deaminase/5-amino-6-(5-phosphoribosylamino)uracil reductase